MRFILIFLITYVCTALASPVQDESTNIADLGLPIDSSSQLASWDHGNLALSDDAIVADSPSVPASPSIPLNSFIAANPSDPTTSSNQNSPSDQITPSSSVQIASSGNRKGHCSPGGTQTTGKVRRGDSCTYSWEDDPHSREDFICPVEFHLLCCRGPKFRLIFTLGCTDYTNAADPRCAPWKIRCCVEIELALQEPGSDTGQDPQWTGVLCYSPLWLEFP